MPTHQLRLVPRRRCSISPLDYFVVHSVHSQREKEEAAGAIVGVLSPTARIGSSLPPPSNHVGNVLRTTAILAPIIGCLCRRQQLLLCPCCATCCSGLFREQNKAYFLNLGPHYKREGWEGIMAATWIASAGILILGLGYGPETGIKVTEQRETRRP